MAVKAEGTALRRSIMHDTAFKKSNHYSLLVGQTPQRSQDFAVCVHRIRKGHRLLLRADAYVQPALLGGRGESAHSNLEQRNNKVEGARQSSISREQREHMDLLIC